MRVSGRSRDTEFAAGFLSVLAARPDIAISPSPEHWRPLAYLGSPYGTVEGDIGLLIRSAGAAPERLVIIEREGSGPGNERSILKWVVAARRGCPITLRRGGETAPTDAQEVLLLLAFAHSTSWGRSDFIKTVAFSQELAEIVNASTQPTVMRLHVHVLGEISTVEGWGARGQATAGLLLSVLNL